MRRTVALILLSLLAGCPTAGEDDDDSVGAPDDDDSAEADDDDATQGWPVEVDLLDAPGIIEGESQLDQMGSAIDLAGDVDGDGAPELLVGAWKHDGWGGRAWLFPATVDGTLSLDQATAVFISEGSEDNAGYAVSGAGDLDADGFDDVMISSPRWTDSFREFGPGTVWLFRGPLEGSIPLQEADARIDGDTDGDTLGLALDGVGDVNGDGYDDVAVARMYNDGYPVLVFLGPIEGALGPADADVLLQGDPTPTMFGYTVAGVGDIDGGGFDDVAVGSPNHPGLSMDGNGGAVHLFRGPLVAGEVGPDDALRIDGLYGGGYFGATIAGGRDVDGDGLDDLLVSGWFEPGCDEPAGGRTHLFLGPVTATSAAEADSVFVGGMFESPEQAGRGLALPGDVDGDGVEDLAIGAPYHSSRELNTGAVYLVHGPLAGREVCLWPDRERVYHGAVWADFTGAPLAALGDVDGDGRGDLAIGSLFSNHDSSTPDRVYLVRGDPRP